MLATLTHRHGQPPCSGTVNIVRTGADGRPEHTVANACMRPVCSLDGAEVTTTEGIKSGSVRLALLRDFFYRRAVSGGGPGNPQSPRISAGSARLGLVMK